MKEFLYFACALLPAFLWIYYFHKKDKNEPEPVRLLIIAAVVGAVFVLPAAYAEIFITRHFFPFLFPNFNLTISSFLLVNLLVVALVEEVFKFLAVRFTVYYSEYFNEYSDGIIYMVSAALGFAAFENFLYFINFGQDIIFVRSLFTPLFHASASAIVGHYLGIYKYEKKYKKKIILAIIFATLLHFLYNFLVFSATLSGNLLYIGLAIILLLLSAKWMFDKFSEAERMDAKCWFCEPKRRNNYHN